METVKKEKPLEKNTDKESLNNVNTLSESQKKILDSHPFYNVDFAKSKRSEKYFREYVVYKFLNIEFPQKEIVFKIGSPSRCVTLNLKAGEKYHLPRYVAMHVNGRKVPVYKAENVNCEAYGTAPIVATAQRFSLMEVGDE